VMATSIMPRALISWAARSIACDSKGTMGRPSTSWPPGSIYVACPTNSRRSSGQSVSGGTHAVAGNPRRTAATGLR
jgi:hypothetical protein